MKVYIVVKSINYEGYCEPEAVFDSKEKAEEYIKTEWKTTRADSIDYFELEVG